MADLERALFPASLPPVPPEGYQRLYFGAEFCCWCFPAKEKLHEALSWSRSVGWRFTLVTPVLAESERQQLQPLLQEFVPLLDANTDEVVISDWGALELVRSANPAVTVALGRALSGQKRGPRILDMQLSPGERDYFRKGSWYGESAGSLLAQQGIRRVELDNLLQGVAALPPGLQGSLHLPYAMVTSSRNCPHRPPGVSGPCPAPCGEVLTLRPADTKVPLLQAGNTQFLENPSVPGDLEQLGIDRLVHHPQLPR